MELKQLIHDAVLKEESKQYKGIHASALGGCPRAHYWKIKGVKPTTPPNLGALLNFKLGYAWEDCLFPLLEDVNVKVKRHIGETWYDKDLNLYGTPDFSIEIDKKNIIVDAKTVNSKWFWYKEGEFKRELLKNPNMTKQEFLLKDNHNYELQQASYLLLAKRMGLDYDHARLVFVDKNDSFIGWEVEVQLTPELEKEIIAKCDYINRCLKTDTLPKCTCEGWEVGYSDYGRPSTREQNKAKKWVNTECCPDSEEILNEWREEAFADDKA